MPHGLRARAFVAATVIALLVSIGLAAFLVPFARAAVDDGDKDAITVGVIGAALVAAGVLIAAAAVVAEMTTRPLARLRTTLRAAREAGGTRAAGIAEIDAVIDEFNALARALDEERSAKAAQQDRLEQTLSAAADVVIAVAPDRSVVFANTAASTVLSVGVEEAVGRPLPRVLTDHEVHELIGEAMKSGEAERIIRREQRQFQVRARRIEGGGEWAAVALLQDVTALQQAEAARRELVDNVSHELRTPVASISAAIETLESGVEPEDAARFHRIIHTETDRMAQTVEEMLDLARLESGLAQPQIRPVAAGTLLRDAADRMQPQAERAGLRLVVNEAPPLPVDADADLVQRALVNLLHNAIKFTPGPGTIRLAAQPDDGLVWLEVIDTGIGIAPEDQPKVFQRFFRSDVARHRAGGTGLGLALVRHIAEAHGGSVRVESEVGKGSTFGLSLLRSRTGDRESLTR